MLLELLYEALRADVGIKVITDDVTALRQRLYALRKQDPDLAILSFIQSPINLNGELWIINRERLKDVKAGSRK